MDIMNGQASRVGKLQLELDQERARQLARALAAAAAFSPDPAVRLEAFRLNAWVNHRMTKRWGVTDATQAESQTGIDTRPGTAQHGKRGGTATGPRRVRA